MNFLNILTIKINNKSYYYGKYNKEDKENLTKTVKLK